MVGLRAGSLSSSRLLGDVAAESGLSRDDFSKPKELSADHLVASGPKGGPGSPQDRRYHRILKNQNILMQAATHVVDDPYKLRTALGVRETMDVTKTCLHDAKGRLAKVVMDKVQHAFLETSLCHSRSPLRQDRLKGLRSDLTWAQDFGAVGGGELRGKLDFIGEGTRALDGIERAQVLKTEAQSVAARAAAIGANRPLKSGMSRKTLAQLNASPGQEESSPRAPEVIVTEAMEMLRTWKHHEEVTHALCDALLTMAEVCGEDFQEEMGRKGLGVLASTIADIWSSKTDVCRSALRLLGVCSVELLISCCSENVAENAMFMNLGLEVLNRVAKQSQEGLDDVARYGGRELLDDIERYWASKDMMINLHALNLRRRLRKSKVKSLKPRLDVSLPDSDVIRIRGCFEAVDADGSGEIDEEELGAAFRMMGMKLDDQELHKAFLEVDLDGSGTVEWPEFLFLMSKFGAGESLESKFTEERLAELREVFNLFDEDGNGTLDADELALVMRSVGLVPSMQEIKNMIDEVDADGSGSIEWPEFLFLMSRNVVKPDEQHKFAFEFFDRANEGKIQRTDFVMQMRQLTQDFNVDELEEMFLEAKFEDADTEQLTYKEFVKMMMR
eukprot:TRINITY_DN57965_c0_g1_i1.p1 TRINITY_DN57965_c0_g1~~TRINITY_DN57965_c0_g1_i1.p1  ORF type:complete len:616 (-),score=151.25 TRINITY_DN57965_c0_g1_i1:24-1871(-)